MSKLIIIKIIFLIISLIVFIFYPYGIVYALIGYLLSLFIRSYLLKYIVKSINKLKKCIQNRHILLDYCSSIIKSNKYTLCVILTILIATTITSYYLFVTYHSDTVYPIKRYSIVGDDDDDDDDDDDMAYPIQDYYKYFDHIITIHYVESINKWVVEDEIISPSLSMVNKEKTHKVDTEYGNLLIKQSTHSITIIRKRETAFNESYFGLSRLNSLELDNSEILRSILLKSIDYISKFNDNENISNVEYRYILRSSNVNIRVPKFMIGKTYPPVKSRIDLLDGGKVELDLSVNSFEFKRTLYIKPEIRLEVINPILRNELLHGLHKIHYLKFLKWLILALAFIFADKIKELFIEPIVRRILIKIKPNES